MQRGKSLSDADDEWSSETPADDDKSDSGNSPGRGDRPRESRVIVSWSFGFAIARHSRDRDCNYGDWSEGFMRDVESG